MIGLRKRGNVFKQIFQGKVVVVGVGNVLRGDDGLGPMFVERLKKKAGLLCINAGNSLENYLGRIAREKPDTVLLVDAVHLGLRPGAYEILNPEEIERSGLSTHDISPRLFLDFLIKEIRGKIFLLGIQPKRLALGARVSGRVRRTLQILESRIGEAMN